jgi:maleate isomerase
MKGLRSDSGIELDEGRHPRGKIGFVVLSMEQTVEDDVFQMTPAGIGVHFTRVPMSNGVSAEALAAMAPHIVAACELLLPADRPNVLCYTCNAGTMVIGERETMRLMRSETEGAAVTTVMTGVVRALVALSAKKLAIVTPYTDDINQIVRDFIGGYSFDIHDFKGMNIGNNSDIDRVVPSFIQRYATTLNYRDADVIFLCCGALRSLEIVEALEAQTGKPVICSNQAMMWDCLRLAGIDDRLKGFGSLFDHGVTDHEAAVRHLQGV